MYKEQGYDNRSSKYGLLTGLVGVIAILSIIIVVYVLQDFNKEDLLISTGSVVTNSSYKNSFKYLAEKQKSSKSKEEIAKEEKVEDAEKLSENFIMTITAAEFDELLKLIQAEAGNQSYDGQVAVVQVVMRRVKVNNSNFHDIIFADNQFSCITDGGYDKAVPSASVTQAVNDALKGKKVIDSRCYYYYNPEYADDSWDDEDWVEYCCTIGDHEFFFDPYNKNP